MKKYLLEQYQDGETIYFIFEKNTPEKTIYKHLYQQAIKLEMKVGNLIYRDSILQITLNQF